jgi:hypothetical protein
MSMSRSMCIHVHVHVHVAALVLWRSGPDSDSARGEGVGRYLGTCWLCPPHLLASSLSSPPHSPHHLDAATHYSLLTHAPNNAFSNHRFPSLVCWSPHPCTPPCSPALSVPAGALLRRAKHARFREGLAEGMRRHGSLLPEISARAALLPWSHGRLLCPASSPPSLECLSSLDPSLV